MAHRLRVSVRCGREAVPEEGPSDLISRGQGHTGSGCSTVARDVPLTIPPWFLNPVKLTLKIVAGLGRWFR